MLRSTLLASAALLVLAAPVFAQGKGQGQGQGGGYAENQGKGGGGGGKARGDDARHVERGRGGDRGSVERTRGSEKRAERVAAGSGRQGGPDRRVGRGRGVQKPEKAFAERGGKFGPARSGDRNDDRVRVRYVEGNRYHWQQALLPGCPPGLAKKNNGCLPPGQARKLARSGDLYRYAPWYADAARYDWGFSGGYAYRIDPATGLVSAFLPLIGGALFNGHAWPAAYTDYAIDPYYARYYGYDDDYDYRYYDNTLFAVDRDNQEIESIAALLAGDRWAVGEPMPTGYGYYNVPPTYRDRYYDGPDSWHRYSDGYVYRVDPTTQLVTAVIQLLT